MRRIPCTRERCVLPDGSGGLFDFQLAVRGHWANDVTCLLVTVLGIEARRKHEPELLAFYLDTLGRHGVAAPPDAEEAWRCHRLATLWGLVIGWLITPPVNYGPAITDANVAQTTAACRDLEAFGLLA